MQHRILGIPMIVCCCAHLFTVGLIFGSELAQRRCTSCGQVRDCRKVWRLKRVEHQEVFTVWGVACEPVALPGPAFPAGQRWERVCEHPEDCRSIQVVPKEIRWWLWHPPVSAQLYPKKKLMKKTLVRMVPSWRWVREELCSECYVGTKKP